jgi:hypothetical protein
MLEQMAKGIMNPTLHLAQNIKDILNTQAEKLQKPQGKDKP